MTFEIKVQRGNNQQQKWWGGISDNELFNGPQLKKEWNMIIYELSKRKPKV